jgi:hypothetical protein
MTPHRRQLQAPCLCKPRLSGRLPGMLKPLRFIVTVLAATAALPDSGTAQVGRSPLVGCWQFTSGRGALVPTSGGGFGTLPLGMVFADSLLFSRENDRTYSMRALATGDSAAHWSPRRLVATWHPHTDSVFAAFTSRRGQMGVALRFRILGDSLDGMARPYTRRTRWEPDVPVTARRVSCDSARGR